MSKILSTMVKMGENMSQNPKYNADLTYLIFSELIEMHIFFFLA